MNPMEVTMSSTTNHKYFVYARKSTDTEDRQVRSIGDQLAEIRELALKQARFLARSSYL